MKRQVAGSRWYRVGLPLLVCLLLNMDSSTARLTREQLLDMCANQIRIQEALAGTASVGLTCDTANMIISGDITWSLQRVGEADATLLDTSLPKYQVDFNRLMINSIVAEDDGIYSCHFTSESSGNNSQTNGSEGCIYVLGTAKFASCEDTTPCSENIPAVTSPNATVDLNVSVDFFRQGASGVNQPVHRLDLYNSVNVLIYTCENEGSSKDVPCEDSGRIVVEQGGSHKYDIVLHITNSMPEDSGIYTAVLEVEKPQTSGRTDITKTFMVTVTDTHTHSFSPTSTTPSHTMLQPIPNPTTNTLLPTASNTDGGQLTADSSDQTIVIAVAVPLSFMIFILMIIFVAAVIFLVVTRRDQHKAHTSATNPEIELTKSPSLESRQSSDSVNQSTCPVCLTEPRITALTCGHLLCSECAQKVDNCPICRQPISHRIRLFQ